MAIHAILIISITILLFFAFSTLSKLISGRNPLELKGLIVPLAVGILVGIILAKAFVNIKKYQNNLEQLVEDRTIKLKEEIAERIYVEKILKQFKFTLDQTLDSVFMFAPKTLKFIYVNQGAIEQVGYSQNELYDMTPLYIKPEYTKEEFKNILSTLVDGSKVSHIFETVHRHKDGTLIPVEIFLQYINFENKDEKGRFMAIVRDISERKQAENDRKNAFQRLVIILDSIDALVYVAGIDSYEVSFINKYGREIFGNAVGKKCWRIFQKDQSGPCEFCTNKHLFDSEGNPGDTYVWEMQNTLNDHWYTMRDKAIEWVDGRLSRIQIATDITVRKQAEKQKEALIAKLEKALDEINTLRGILPICSFCKNIRNDEGYYEQIEWYIHKHSGVDFSHTVCPQCMKKHYPECLSTSPIIM